MVTISMSCRVAVAVALFLFVLMPNAARAQTCFGQAPTSGCNVNGGKKGPCVGTAGNDVIKGSNDTDVIIGLGGHDTISGGGKGQDRICGGEGSDDIKGGSDASMVDGGGGNDTVKGGSSGDTILGGAGNDSIDGGNGDDSIDGGADTDSIDGGPGVDTCSGEQLTRCESPPTTTTTSTTSTSTTSTTTTTSTTSTSSTSMTTITVPPTSTTTSTTVTTTSSTSTTTIASDVCFHLQLTFNAGTGVVNTATELDEGWTGLHHDQDLPDKSLLMLDLQGDPVCAGQTLITGVNPTPGNCRCENDNGVICDEPFSADANDCAGNQCKCYVAPPQPRAGGGLPICVVRELAGDVAGTWNVDTGAANISIRTRQKIYTGETAVRPCPTCGGTCIEPPANVGNPCNDSGDCDTSPGSSDGICGNLDISANDGLREGTCFGGANHGDSCDSHSFDSSFPDNNGTYSYDCFPASDELLDLDGVLFHQALTTGTASLTAALPCGPSAEQTCPCGVCSGDTRIPCTNNADCGEAPQTCGVLSSSQPEENLCESRACSDAGGEEGECTTGPDDVFCDGITRANGRGLVSCFSNADCAPENIGVDAGNCTLVERRSCFLDTILASGVAHPENPTLVSTYCVGRSSSAAANVTLGFPGPARVRMDVESTALCANDPEFSYPLCDSTTTTTISSPP